MTYKISPELFPASPGAQWQEGTVITFSIQLGKIRVGSKNVLTVISGNWAPGEAGNSSGYIFGENSKSF